MQYKIKELGQTLEHYEIYLKSNNPQKKVVFVKGRSSSSGEDSYRLWKRR